MLECNFQNLERVYHLAFKPYRESKDQACDAVKLTAYHTKETASQVREAALQAHLTSEYCEESIALL